MLLQDGLFLELGPSAVTSFVEQIAASPEETEATFPVAMATSDDVAPIGISILGNMFR